MFGWFSDASTRASRSNRARRPACSMKRCGSTLSATSRSRRVSRARYTSPMPPSPRRPSTRYGPSRLPTSIASSRDRTRLDGTHAQPRLGERRGETARDRDYYSAAGGNRDRWYFSWRRAPSGPHRHQDAEKLTASCFSVPWRLRGDVELRIALELDLIRHPEKPPLQD